MKGSEAGKRWCAQATEKAGEPEGSEQGADKPGDAMLDGEKHILGSLVPPPGLGLLS